MSFLDGDYTGSAPEPGIADLQQRLHENWAMAAKPDAPGGHPRQASSIWEAMEAGWQMGTTSLAANYVAGGGSPNLYVSENQGRMMNIASHAATLVGDIPAMMAGGAAGELTPIPGGAMAGSFALPAFIRRAVVDSYTKGSARNFTDFWDRASGAMVDAGKGAVTGLATAGAGALGAQAGGFLGSTFGELSSSAAAALGKSGGELGAMTLVGHALDGKGLPSKDDFLEGGLLIAGAHGAGVAAGALMESWRRTGLPLERLTTTIASDPKAQAQVAGGIVPDFVGQVEAQQHAEAGISVDRSGTLTRRGEPMSPLERDQWVGDNPEMAEQLRAAVPKTEVTAGAEPTPLEAAQEKFDAINDKMQAPREPGSTEPIPKAEWVKAKQELEDLKAASLGPSEEEPVRPDPTDPSIISVSRSSLGENASAVPGGPGFEDGESAPVPPTPPAAGAPPPTPPAAGAPPPTPPAAGAPPPTPPAAGAPITYDDATAHVRSRVDLNGEPPDPRSFGERWRDWWNNLYNSAYDGVRNTLQLDRAINGKWISSRDSKVLMAMRQRAGVADQMQDALYGAGVREFKTNKLAVDGQGKTVGSFQSIMDDVKSKADVAKFRDFAISARALEVNARAKAENRVNPTGIDSDYAQVVYDKLKPEYEQYQKRYVEYHNALSRYARDAGLVTADGYDEFTDVVKDYAPLRRVFEDGERVGASVGGISNPIKEQKGSQLVIVDPFQSTIENTGLIIKSAQMNRAGRALYDAATANPQNAGLFEDVTKPLAPGQYQKVDWRNGEVPVFVDGDRRIIKTAPDIAQTLMGVDQQLNSPIISALGKVSTLERMGILNTPGFIARHAIRNPLMSLFFSQNPVVFAGNTLTSFMGEGTLMRGVFDAVGDFATQGAASFSDRMGAGGGSSIMAKMDRDYLSKNVVDLTNKADWQGKAWNLIRNPMEAMAAMGKMAHSVAGTSDNLIKQGDYNASIAQGFSPQEAAYRSRQVIPDAARVGSQMRIINSLVPFFHMEWQGMDQLARMAIESPQTRARLAMVGGSMASVSAALWMLNRNDSRMDEIPHEQRDLFWCIPTDSWKPVDLTIPGAEAAAMSRPEDQRKNVNGQLFTNEGAIFRIPKPFEAGIIFGSGTERVMESLVKDNPHAFDGYGADLANAAFRLPIPAFAKPAIEQFANRSTFTGNPLIPSQVEKELPQYRYNDYTTQTGKILGKMATVVPWLGKTTFASPIVIENYVRSYSGTVGYMLMNLADKGLKAAGIAPDKVSPESTWADNIFTQAFVIKNPGFNMQGIRDFYDSYKEFEMIKATAKNMAAQGNMQEVQRLQQLEMANSGGVNLEQTAKALAVNAHLIRQVMENPDMKPYEKRQLIDGYYYMMSLMANQGNKMVDAARRIALQ